MYSDPHQMQPMLPSEHEWLKLGEKTEHIVLKASLLSSGAPAATLEDIRTLVRSMNSYYSNRIEGQGTHPANIEKALRNDFSASPEIAALQRLALAHIQAEQELEEAVSNGELPLSSDFAIHAHTALYGRLSEDDRLTPDGEVTIPGQLRNRDVQVGRHVAPKFSSVPDFLSAFDRFYAKPWAPQRSLIATACAHHRLSWIHPFIDGNGRTSRLQTHASLMALSHGLWSVNRGLARNKDDYYNHLAAADSQRQGDLDGRGNLSEKGLITWVDYFLDTCLDQVNFMTELLDLQNMRQRIEGYIAYHTAIGNKKLRKEAALPLQHLFAFGNLERGEFMQMTGLGERTARYLLSELIKLGVVKSKSSHAPLQFGFPMESLSLLLPNLYPEASTKV